MAGAFIVASVCCVRVRALPDDCLVCASDDADNGTGVVLLPAGSLVTQARYEDGMTRSSADPDGGASASTPASREPLGQNGLTFTWNCSKSPGGAASVCVFVCVCV